MTVVEKKKEKEKENETQLTYPVGRVKNCVK
jgi:hypothetical protein